MIHAYDYGKSFFLNSYAFFRFFAHFSDSLKRWPCKSFIFLLPFWVSKKLCDDNFCETKNNIFVKTLAKLSTTRFTGKNDVLQQKNWTSINEMLCLKKKKCDTMRKDDCNKTSMRCRRKSIVMYIARTRVFRTKQKLNFSKCNLCVWSVS